MQSLPSGFVYFPGTLFTSWNSSKFEFSLVRELELLVKVALLIVLCTYLFYYCIKTCVHNV